MQAPSLRVGNLLGLSVEYSHLHTLDLEEVKLLLKEGVEKLPLTKLTASEVLNSTSDPQRNRRLDLACRYFAQFRDWPLPMDDLSIELLKLRLRHALEHLGDESFQLSETVSPMVYVLNNLWHRNSQAWLKEGGKFRHPVRWGLKLFASETSGDLRWGWRLFQ